jgi:3-methyladenine DNA glycosylase AlkD
VDAPAVAACIDLELRRAGDTTRADTEKRYLKSAPHHYGTSVPAIRRIAKAGLADGAGLTRYDLLLLVDDLWSREVHEARMAAVEILQLRSELLEPNDLELVERFIRESKTWALVDGLAASVAGPLIERFPQLSSTLDRWAGDEDFWVRRSALLELMLPLRSGEGDVERFARYTDAMLGEREFFIRKAIGWVLREAAKTQPDRVFGWLEPRAARASGVTVREAVKYLPEDQRAAILDARYRKAGTRAGGR